MEIFPIDEQIRKVDPIMKSEWSFMISDWVSIFGLSSDTEWSRKYTCNNKGVTTSWGGVDYIFQLEVSCYEI